MSSPQNGKKRKRQAIPKDESKHDKFKRVCTPRLNKALKSIHLIAACSTKDYDYNKEQVEVIIHNLITAVSMLEKQFAGKNAAENAVSL